MLFLPKNFIKGNANMSNRKQTKRALLTSIMALVMCVVMLVGATFAWFTDTASTNVNTIKAGNLKVLLMDKAGNDLEGRTLNWVKAEDGRNQQVLWEPGCSYDLESFKIKNNGNLKLKYKVLINGLIGNAELLKAIDFTVAVAGPALTPKDGTPTVSTVAALNSFEGTLDAGAETGLITITGKMRTDAGNTYQGKTIDGIAITVYAAQMTGEYDSSINNYDEDATYDYTFVASDEEAETALSANEKNIYVALAGDVSFDVNVSATPSKLLGGADTELIVIEGHGHKLTFHNSNNDSGTVSRAGKKLVIKNAVIDNSGYNAAGGAWNSHDIVFNGEVELENVTFTNAVALNGKATLTNVEISDQNAAQDTYMLWIRAGSDVTLNNVTINGRSAVGKANRAIAIKDEYIDNPTETTLTVNGLTATSDKYAAIYVTSKSATTINLNGVIDVTGAAVSDKLIQESSDSTGTVTVNDNSTKVVKAATQEELENAIAAVETGKSAKVELREGTYNLPTAIPASVSISGAGMGETQLTAPATPSWGNQKTGLMVKESGVTISNATITGHSDITSNMYCGVVDVREGGTTLESVEIVNQTSEASGIVINSGVDAGETVTMKNSKLNVYYRAFYIVDGANGTIEIDNCDITGSLYAINVNSASSQDLVIKCTNSKLHGWSSYSEIKSASFENVEFSKGASDYDYLRPYADTTLKNCTFDDGFKMGAGTTGFTITIEDCTYNGMPLTAANVKSLMLDSGNLNELKGCMITVNGATVTL